MSESVKKYKLGWLPDLPDFRDYTVEHTLIFPELKRQGVQSPISTMVENLKTLENDEAKIPASADFRNLCSPIENQGEIGSCTANAAVGLVEYFERRAFGKYIDASRLFLYKVTRTLLGFNGDTGAYLRSTIGALTIFGLVPEKYWPYDVNKFDDEPSAFCYSFADKYKTLQYYRLDPPSTTTEVLLNRIRSFIASGIPSIFGFTVYDSIEQASSDGKIPFPSNKEQVLGGHAVMAVGYDDNLVIENKFSNNKTVGALLIRNSWGEDWGEKGYGWIPYEYIYKELAVDWWLILKNEWIDSGEFGF